MRVLITRPRADAAAIAAELEAIGFAVSFAPLIEITYRPLHGLDRLGAQALILTSRNAARALRRHPGLAELRAIRIFAVGGGTMELVRELGFGNVISGAGGARDLAPLIAQNAEPSSGPIVHLAGSRLAYDLGADLTQRGLTYRSIEAYCTREADVLPDQVADELRSGAIDAVMLMSPRTAEVFVGLVAEANLASAARRLRYWCLSPTVAAALSGLGAADIEIAAQPNRQEMLALAARVAAKSG